MNLVITGIKIISRNIYIIQYTFETTDKVNCIENDVYLFSTLLKQQIVQIVNHLFSTLLKHGCVKTVLVKN